MNNLQILLARQQLLEDINAIVLDIASDFDFNGMEFNTEYVTGRLNDAVLNHFPNNFNNQKEANS
tara:strand:- start:143 stop:337 length:195 start_codon:yes stop_codon:yes gene_type:complete